MYRTLEWQCTDSDAVSWTWSLHLLSFICFLPTNNELNDMFSCVASNSCPWRRQHVKRTTLCEIICYKFTSFLEQPAACWMVHHNYWSRYNINIQREGVVSLSTLSTMQTTVKDQTRSDWSEHVRLDGWLGFSSIFTINSYLIPWRYATHLNHSQT